MIPFVTPPALTQGAAAIIPGQVVFTTSDTWVVPATVTSISAVCISRGMDGQPVPAFSKQLGGSGGMLRYANDIAVTPGETLTIYFENNELGTSVAAIRRSGTDLVRAGSSPVGTGYAGGSGAFPDYPSAASGGGAGGYTSAGGSTTSTSGLAGAGTSLLGGGAGAAGNAVGGINGGLYGGGAACVSGSPGYGGTGGAGGIRIIWGAGRAYPNTNTADV